MKISVMVICLLSLLYMPPASAAYVTGDELAASCEGDTPQDIFTCTGYIAGVIDYHVIMQSLGTTPTIDFCLPETLSLDAAAFTVMQYLKKAPQHDSFIAAPTVTMALHEKYPCGPVAVKKKKKHAR